MSKGEEDLGAKYTLYRWHIQDPVRFTRSFRFEIEHTGWITGDETVTAGLPIAASVQKINMKKFMRGHSQFFKSDKILIQSCLFIRWFPIE